MYIQNLRKTIKNSKKFLRSFYSNMNLKMMKAEVEKEDQILDLMSTHYEEKIEEEI